MGCKHGSKSLDDGIGLSGAHDSNFDKSGEVINYHQVPLTLMLAEVDGNLVPGQFGKGAGLERFSRVGSDGCTGGTLGDVMLNSCRHAGPPDSVAGSDATLHYALVSVVDGVQGGQAKTIRYDRAMTTIHHVVDHGKFVADSVVGL